MEEIKEFGEMEEIKEFGEFGELEGVCILTDARAQDLDW